MAKTFEQEVRDLVSNGKSVILFIDADSGEDFLEARIYPDGLGSDALQFIVQGNKVTPVEEAPTII